MSAGVGSDLDGFASVLQDFSMHFLHSQTRLRRFGELDIANAFGLLRLLVFDHPNVLDVAKRREPFPELLFGDESTGHQEQAAVGRVVQVLRGWLRVCVRLVHLGLAALFFASSLFPVSSRV